MSTKEHCTVHHHSGGLQRSSTMKVHVFLKSAPPGLRDTLPEIAKPPSQTWPHEKLRKKETRDSREPVSRKRGVVSWVKARSGVVKLNIDGVVDAKTGTYGTRAVCRDENGTCLGVLASSVTGLDKSLEDFSEAGALMDEAKALISSFEVCSWGFVQSVCNRVAHEVAKLAISLPYPTYWYVANDA
ncbi:hypothetical protein ACLB2K_022317 [Fragaria x ananassa]